MPKACCRSMRQSSYGRRFVRKWSRRPAPRCARASPRRQYAMPWLVYRRRGGILGCVCANGHRPGSLSVVGRDVGVRSLRSASPRDRALLVRRSVRAASNARGSALCRDHAPGAGAPGLHQSLGFEPVGIYRSAGCKLDAWHDVGWWQRFRADGLSAPKPPIPFAALGNDIAALETAWQAGLSADPGMKADAAAWPAAQRQEPWLSLRSSRLASSSMRRSIMRWSRRASRWRSSSSIRRRA